jgi:hypothetical protein
MFREAGTVTSRCSDVAVEHCFHCLFVHRALTECQLPVGPQENASRGKRPRSQDTRTVRLESRASDGKIMGKWACIRAI